MITNEYPPSNDLQCLDARSTLIVSIITSNDEVAAEDDSCCGLSGLEV